MYIYIYIEDQLQLLLFIQITFKLRIPLLRSPLSIHTEIMSPGQLHGTRGRAPQPGCKAARCSQLATGACRARRACGDAGRLRSGDGGGGFNQQVEQQRR